jgi:hypothetical protein
MLFCSVGQSCLEDVWRNGRLDPRIYNLDTREVSGYIHASANLYKRNEPLVLSEYEVRWASNPAEFGGEEIFPTLP